MLPASFILGSSALVIATACVDIAHAHRRLEATYTISVARIPVGHVVATADLTDNEYSVSASVRIIGAVRLLTSGEGTSEVRGTVVDGRLMPSNFASRGTFQGIPPEMKMEFEDGHVKKLDSPAPSQDRVPLTEAHRRGVIDPLTAMLVSVGATKLGVNQHACERKVPVFDGYQRYDLSLTFKRMENIQVSGGYTGPAVVCSARYKPIAGYRPEAALLKFLSSRDIEVALAPVAAARVMVPIRILIESIVANLLVQADRFETKPQ